MYILWSFHNVCFLDKIVCLGLDFIEYLNIIGVLPVKKIELNNFA